VRGVLVGLLLLAGCDRLFALSTVSTHDARSADDGAPPLDTEPPDAPGDAVVDPMVLVDASTSCPAGYGLHGGLMVREVTAPQTWLVAMQDCVDDVGGNSAVHTHLIVYTNDIQRGQVGATTANAFWIGYSDRRFEANYLWVTNEPNSYPGIGDQPWAANEPSEDDVDDNCVLQRGVDDWDTVDCAGNFIGYMCECDAYPSDANRY